MLIDVIGPDIDEFWQKKDPISISECFPRNDAIPVACHKPVLRGSDEADEQSEKPTEKQTDRQIDR